MLMDDYMQLFRIFVCCVKLVVDLFLKIFVLHKKYSFENYSQNKLKQKGVQV